MRFIPVKLKVLNCDVRCSFCPLSRVLETRSAVMSSCVFGASAVQMQQKEKLAALVSTRLTAAQTSAVLSIKVQHSTR